MTGNPNIDANRANYSEEELEKIDKIGSILNKQGGVININTNQLKLFGSNYTSLTISSQNLETLEDLEGLTNLTYLNLTGNKITLKDKKSQDILKSMTKLKSLILNNNPVEDLSAINSLTNLTLLSIGKATEVDLSQIEDVISNLSLTITDKAAQTISNCSVDKVTKLNINCGGGTLPDIRKFTKLNSLSITNTKVEDRTIIESLSSLTSLTISNSSNLRENMPDLSKLKNLNSITLSYCGLWSEDLVSLEAFSSKQNMTINLKNNSIIDISTLLKLDPSTKLSLGGNVNINDESKKELQNRFGKNVTF